MKENACRLAVGALDDKPGRWGSAHLDRCLGKIVHALRQPKGRRRGGAKPIDGMLLGGSGGAFGSAARTARWTPDGGFRTGCLGKERGGRVQARTHRRGRDRRKEGVDDRFRGGRVKRCQNASWTRRLWNDDDLRHPRGRAAVRSEHGLQYSLDELEVRQTREMDDHAGSP